MLKKKRFKNSLCLEQRCDKATNLYYHTHVLFCSFVLSWVYNYPWKHVTAILLTKTNAEGYLSGLWLVMESFLLPRTSSFNQVSLVRYSSRLYSNSFSASADALSIGSAMSYQDRETCLWCLLEAQRHLLHWLCLLGEVTLCVIRTQSVPFPETMQTSSSLHFSVCIEM